MQMLTYHLPCLLRGPTFAVYPTDTHILSKKRYSGCAYIVSPATIPQSRKAQKFCEIGCPCVLSFSFGPLPLAGRDETARQDFCRLILLLLNTLWGADVREECAVQEAESCVEWGSSYRRWPYSPGCVADHMTEILEVRMWSCLSTGKCSKVLTFPSKVRIRHFAAENLRILHPSLRILYSWLPWQSSTPPRFSRF